MNLRTTTKSLPLLQPEHGFCQQNGPERVLQGKWVLYRINKDEGDESLLHLAFQRDVVNVIFLKYSKEDT